MAMDTHESIPRAVVDRWKRVLVDEDDQLYGAENVGATNEALDAFERRHAVTLPRSFRELYALSDGTAEMDGHEQLFWGLTTMGNVLDSFDAGDADAIWIGFADFRLQMVVFYLRADRRTGSTSVWIDRHAHSGKPLLSRVEKLVESFDEYLARYAEDPLFWRASPKKKPKKKPAR
jgi:hypothetical protein